MDQPAYPRTSWIDSRAEERPSPIHGFGYFASAPIHDGEVIARFGGDLMSDDEFRAFHRSTERYNAIQVDENAHLVEPPDLTRTQRGSLNHSCDPNLWMADPVTIVARRDIAAGEELTIDYALFTTQPDWQLDRPCSCGSALCRGTVTGNDWQRPDLQQRYAGHFSPFINRRIARLTSADDPGTPDQRV